MKTEKINSQNFKALHVKKQNIQRLRSCTPDYLDILSKVSESLKNTKNFNLEWRSPSDIAIVGKKGVSMKHPFVYMESPERINIETTWDGKYHIGDTVTLRYKYEFEEDAKKEYEHLSKNQFATKRSLKIPHLAEIVKFMDKMTGKSELDAICKKFCSPKQGLPTNI